MTPTKIVPSLSTTPRFLIPDMFRTSTLIGSITPVATAITFAGQHQLEVPIGTDYKFIIHRVLGGENLEQYATKYDTSVQAIIALNYAPITPLWSNMLVVIPLGFTDYVKLPSFKVYQVKETDRGISVEDLAAYLHVSPLDLKYYNGWTQDGDRPLVGDFLLVARPRLLPTATRTPSQTPTVSPFPSKTWTASPTRTPTRTMTSSPTTKLSAHRLDVPIGSDYKFLIHKVFAGENLTQLADKYNTSVDAILKVNFTLNTPLWVDALVIIPVGNTYVDSFPVFDAYQVTRPDESIEALAQELGVSASDVKYFNDLKTGESLQIGDWLLMPHARPAS